MRRAIALAAALALMGMIIWESHRDSIEIGSVRYRGPTGPYGNLCHIAAFGGLAALLAIAADRHGRAAGLGTLAGMVAWGVTTAFGFTDEIHQAFTPGRTCSLFDLVLDGAGAAVALMLPWPKAPGRRRGPLLGFLILGGAVVLALATGGKDRSDLDRCIETAIWARFGRPN